MRRVLLALVALCACGREVELGGSVGELFSLEVSGVEVLRNEDAFQLTYVRNRGTELDIVVRVSIALSEVKLRPGARISLEGEYAPGHPRTTVVHAPGGEPVRVFPRVEDGDLFLHSGGAVGEATRGNISIRFAPEGGDLGAGRTLTGAFAGVARDAGFE